MRPDFQRNLDAEWKRLSFGGNSQGFECYEVRARKCCKWPVLLVSRKVMAEREGFAAATRNEAKPLILSIDPKFSQLYWARFAAV
jgi:hypothetical protein